MVAMEGWGFIRYGEDILLPASEYTYEYNVKVGRMMNYYTQIETEAVKKSYIYAPYYKEKLRGILDELKTPYSNLYDSFQYRAPANPDGTGWKPAPFNPYWDQAIVDIKEGKRKINNAGVTIDTRHLDGAGIFTDLYELSNGVKAINGHLVSLDGGHTYLSNNISLIDLFHKYSLKEEILSVYGLYSIKNGNYKPNYFNSDLSSVYGSVLRKLTKNISRETYQKKIQGWLCRFVELTMSKHGLLDQIKETVDVETMLQELPIIMKHELLTGDPIGLLGNIFMLADVLMENTDAAVDWLYDFIFFKYKDFLKIRYGLDLEDIESKFTYQDRQDIRKGLKVLVQAIANMMKGIEGSEEVFALVMNSDKLILAHYPELCLAWLQSQDENYSSQNTRVYVPSSKRVIRLNCPVDVVVYDSQGRIVAKIIDNIPQSINESSIACAYTENGEKAIVLPMDESFNVVATATDNGKMDVSIDLYDVEGKCKYLENYYDIELVKGQNVTVALPKEFYVGEDGVEHEIIRECEVVNGTTQESAAIVLLDEAAELANYTVSVENQNNEGGICFGGGEYVLGTYALVSAREYEDCEFIGWFEDGTIVSEEREYRFRVTRNVSLEARFAGKTNYGRRGVFEATLLSEEGGSIWGYSSIKAFDGYPVEIIAVPFDGYEFVGWETTGNCIIDDVKADKTNLTLVDENVSVVAKFKEIEIEKPAENQDGYELISEGITISYRTTTAWTGGYNGEITIRNNTGKELSDWKLEFTSTNGIAGTWNGQLDESDDNRYAVTSYDWNAKIPTGQMVTIGFTAVGNYPVMPSEMKLFVKKQAGNEEKCEISFVKTNEWSNGCVGDIIIKNTSVNMISDWTISFQYDGNVNNLWNGMITSHNGNQYVVKNAGFNANIRPGETVRIGVELAKGFNTMEPYGYSITCK